MGEPALNKTNDPLAIEGLELFFDSSEPGSDHKNQPKEPCSEPIESTALEIVSTEEASKRLGITTRAIIKRLKHGTLQGFRDTSKAKAEWRIYWNELSSEPCRTSSSQGTSQHRTNSKAPFERTEPKEPAGTSPSTYLTELNQKLFEQIQVLTYRNGYLEAQLENQREQIKLLMDNQSKARPWTQRIKSWLIDKLK